MCNSTLRTGDGSAENYDYRRAQGATMDPAREALRTVGCATQIGLEKVARSERGSQMRRGRERRDICGFRRRTRARLDDKRRRGVHRHGRVHQASFGNARKATTALDSQVYGVFLTAPSLPELLRGAVFISTKGNLGGRMLSHDRLRTHGRIGNHAFPQCSGRWTRAIGKVMPLSGKTANKFVVVIPIYKSKERTQW